MIQIYDMHTIEITEDLKNKYKLIFCPDCIKDDPDMYVDIESDDAVLLQRVEYYDTEDEEFYEGYWVMCDVCGLHTEVFSDEDDAIYHWNHMIGLSSDYVRYDEPLSDEEMGYEKWFSEVDMRYHYRRID